MHTHTYIQNVRDVVFSAGNVHTYMYTCIRAECARAHMEYLGIMEWKKERASSWLRQLLGTMNSNHSELCLCVCVCVCDSCAYACMRDYMQTIRMYVCPRDYMSKSAPSWHSKIQCTHTLWRHTYNILPVYTCIHAQTHTHTHTYRLPGETYTSTRHTKLHTYNIGSTHAYIHEHTHTGSQVITYTSTRHTKLHTYNAQSKSAPRHIRTPTAPQLVKL